LYQLHEKWELKKDWQTIIFTHEKRTFLKENSDYYIIGVS